MAEWLSRWTSDLMGTVRAGSIPGTGNFVYDDGLAARIGAGDCKVQVLMRVRKTKSEGVKLLRMQAQSPREQIDQVDVPE